MLKLREDNTTDQIGEEPYVGVNTLNTQAGFQ